jgi:hypothetical protein
MKVSPTFSLPFMGRDREASAERGGGSVVAAQPSHGPTRAALRCAVPPHEGEGEIA